MRATLLWLLLTFLVFLVINGCAVGAVDPPATNNDTVACGASLGLRPFTAEYLFGADVLGSNNVWAYQINPSTGALTQMPWSPFHTYNAALAATAAPNGTLFYVDAQGALGSPTDTAQTLETYSLQANGEAPLRVDMQLAGYSRTLNFDPQGKFLHTLDWQAVLNQVSNPATSFIQAYSTDASGKPHLSGQVTTLNGGITNGYAYKADGNLLVVAFNPIAQYGGNGLAVYRENCSEGSTTLLQQQAVNASTFGHARGPIFMAAPKTGDLAVGWDCGLNPALTWMFHVDRNSGALTSYSNSLPGICDLAFDVQDQYAVAVLPHDVRYAHPSDTVAIYRIDPTLGLIETDRFQLPQIPNEGPQDISQARFDAGGNFVYASAVGIYGWKLDRTTGKLTLLPGFPQSAAALYRPLFVVPQ